MVFMLFPSGWLKSIWPGLEYRRPAAGEWLRAVLAKPLLGRAFAPVWPLRAVLGFFPSPFHGVGISTNERIRTAMGRPNCGTNPANRRLAAGLSKLKMSNEGAPQSGSALGDIV
jgi:hypothetical protein